VISYAIAGEDGRAAAFAGDFLLATWHGLLVG
jgi:hypothetical protein